ncbi:MAG: hypothetical protein ACTHN7_09195 [Solirubrobacterales bacterium]
MTDSPSRTPRSAPGLIAEAFGLYRRFPVLFLVLAAGVVVPYRLIVLIATGTAPFNNESLSAGASLLLLLIESVVVDPLISALHVHAVADVEQGQVPAAAAVARRGLAVLPLVAAAAIMAGLAMFGGLILLVLPGVYFFLRLHVVAQAAAIERVSWMNALRRSWSLTEGSALHVLYFVVCIFLISFLPFFLIGIPFRHHATTAASFLIGVGAQILVLSFAALATALLYYDLRARRAVLAREFTAATDV